MKVAIVGVESISLPWINQNGSIEIWNYNIAKYLVKYCDVIVYAKRKRNQKKIEVDQGVIYKRISSDIDRLFTFFTKITGKFFPSLSLIYAKRPYFSSIFYNLFYAIKMAKDIRTENCDIVHIHNLSQFVSVIKVFNPNIKIILHMHCQWLTQLDKEMIKKRLIQTTYIVGCSKDITEKIQQAFPQFSNHCITIYNGVNVDYFLPKNNDAQKKDRYKHLLLVGRISPEKGLHILHN